MERGEGGCCCKVLKVPAKAHVEILQIVWKWKHKASGFGKKSSRRDMDTTHLRFLLFALPSDYEHSTRPPKSPVGTTNRTNKPIQPIFFQTKDLHEALQKFWPADLEFSTQWQYFQRACKCSRNWFWENRPLAVTCPLRSLAATCGHWVGLVGHLLQRPLP